MMHDVLILTPFLPPAPGGAAVYTSILSRGLVEQEIARRVVVVSERHPERPDVEEGHAGRLVLLRLFPFRAGRPVKDLRSYLDYARQQVALRQLGGIVAEHKISTVLVHASLLYHPGLARTVLRRLKRRHRTRIVLDVRDPKLPAHLLAEPGEFDAVICCAERIVRDLGSAFPPYADRLHLVPIPIEPLAVGEDDVGRALARHGLERGGYLFNANGLSAEKSTPLLLDAVAELFRHGRRVPLAIVGRERDRDARALAAIARGELKVLGPVPHGEALALAKAAAAVINPSRIETPSRFSIEGLMLGAPSLLPPEVPEFERSCPELVCAAEPGRLARQIAAVLDGSLRGSRPYDVGEHDPARVLPRYRDALDAALA
jgi:glycosyltransferase involved in cell wall biosynthesis